MRMSRLLFFPLLHFLSCLLDIFLFFVHLLLRLLVHFTITKAFSCSYQVQEFIFTEGLDSMFFDSGEFAWASVIAQNDEVSFA